MTDAIEVRWSRRAEAKGIKRAIQNRGANDEHMSGGRAMPADRRVSQWRIELFDSAFNGAGAR